jgi:YVTN family beta-propeller protein
MISPMTSLTLWKSAFVFRALARVNQFLLALVLSFLAGAVGLAQETAVFSQSANTVPTNRIAARIPVGLNPGFCVVSPDNATLYVANDFSGTVSVIDTATNTVAFTISLGGPLGGMALTPDGAQLYVANDELGSGARNRFGDQYEDQDRECECGRRWSILSDGDS